MPNKLKSFKSISHLHLSWNIHKLCGNKLTTPRILMIFIGCHWNHMHFIIFHVDRVNQNDCFIFDLWMSNEFRHSSSIKFKSLYIIWRLYSLFQISKEFNNKVLISVWQTLKTNYFTLLSCEFNEKMFYISLWQFSVNDTMSMLFKKIWQNCLYLCIHNFFSCFQWAIIKNT